MILPRKAKIDQEMRADSISAAQLDDQLSLVLQDDDDLLMLRDGASVDTDRIS